MQDDNPSDGPRDPISEVFHLYDPPLWLVTARHGGRRGGLIATFAVRASIVGELPRMAVGIAKHHHTWRLIEGSGAFAVHLLRADDLGAVWRFGLASGHDTDKLSGLPDQRTPDGNPLYPEALAWLDCRVEARMDTGDRTLYLTEVSGGAVLAKGPALTVGTLLRDAPADRLAELDRLYRADQALDSAAILAWRRAQGLG
ncbi:MAG: flavin reductase family protein [Chromatiaceae bacterium]|jgi:flavin reductase (DIM6/NTAB) family NADH-FMN oxidoreductase RutF